MPEPQIILMEVIHIQSMRMIQQTTGILPRAVHLSYILVYNVNIKTLTDVYGPGEYVNITDPMILYSEPLVVEPQEQNILSGIYQFLYNTVEYCVRVES